MSVRLTPGSPPGAAVAWCAPLAGADAAPISTTIDGEHEPIVWYVSDGRLTAVDGETGVLISSSRDICGPVLDWTSPIAVKGRLVVGRPDRLCAWSPSR